MDVKLKPCTKCDLVKPYDEFSPHPRTRSRRQSWCKKCVAKHVRASRGAEERTKAEELTIVVKQAANAFVRMWPQAQRSKTGREATRILIAYQGYDREMSRLKALATGREGLTSRQAKWVVAQGARVSL
jgi:hypothetical protein